MDSSIYLDNVRGFSRCLTKLSNVTFLVGENSSGKSSFLALAHLLLSEDFWADLNFNTAGHQLGSFEDLVSKSSKSRSEFTVGCVSRKNIQASNVFGAVVTFGRKEDAPRVVRCTYLHGLRAISYFRIASGFRWIDHGEIEPPSTEFRSDSALRRLVELHGRIKPGSGKLVRKAPTSDRYLTVVMPHTIAHQLENSDPQSADSTFEFVPHEGLQAGTWFAPIRAEPRRIYDNSAELGFSPAGVHTPYLLRDVLRRRRKEGFEKSALDMISAFGTNSGLFNGLEFKSFGRGASAPFTLSVKLDKASFHLGEVGYGVSQILPIVTEMFAARTGLNYFIQQPEVHLHPKAQAEISNIIYIFSANIEDSLIVVETHSDYLIERFRSLVREDYLEESAKIEAAVFWFERRDGRNNVSLMSLDAEGNLPSDIPDGYRDFFLEETLRGLGVDVNN